MATDFEKQTRELYAAYNAHDVEKFLSFHTDDIFCEQVVLDGVVVRGKEEYRTLLKNSFAALPDFKCELTSFFTNGNQQCEECVMSGTHTVSYMGLAPTGKRFSFRGVLVRDLREGKTSRLSLYWDNASFLRQLGAK